jgi:hypothetical protein
VTTKKIPTPRQHARNTPAPGLPVKGSSCEHNVIKASAASILCEGSKGDRTGGGSQSRHHSAHEQQQKEQFDVTSSCRQYPTVPATSCHGIDARFDGDIGYVVIDVSLLRRRIATRGEAVDLSASIFNKINQCAVATRWPPQPPPMHQSLYLLHTAIYY